MARELQQAEARDLADLHPRPVVPQRVAKAILDFALVLRAFHVDEVDDDQAAEVAQAKLPRDLVRGLEIRMESCRLDVAGAGCTR